MCRHIRLWAAYRLKCYECAREQMRIGIDAHMIGSKETGNETYCLGLVEGLTRLDNGNQYVVYVSSNDALPELDQHPNFERRVLRRESSVWRLTVGYARASRAHKLD